MSVDFELFARYAEVNSKDPEKAERIRAKQAEVNDFLDREGLLAIPKLELIEFIQSQRSELWDHRFTHLALVAQEALRSTEGVFVHSNRADMVRALRERAAAGDQRILTHYTDRTLAHQIRDSGDILGRNYPSRRTLLDLLKRPNYDTTYPNQTWKQTLQEWAAAFPGNTEVRDTMWLLIRFNFFSNIPTVEERLQAARADLRMDDLISTS